MSQWCRKHPSPPNCLTALYRTELVARPQGRNSSTPPPSSLRVRPQQLSTIALRSYLTAQPPLPPSPSSAISCVGAASLQPFCNTWKQSLDHAGTTTLCPRGLSFLTTCLSIVSGPRGCSFLHLRGHRLHFTLPLAQLHPQLNNELPQHYNYCHHTKLPRPLT